MSFEPANGLRGEHLPLGPHHRQPLLEHLLPGMSVVTNINTGGAVANGGK